MSGFISVTTISTSPSTLGELRNLDVLMYFLIIGNFVEDSTAEIEPITDHVTREQCRWVDRVGTPAVSLG